jgi:hypothetical protein
MCVARRRETGVESRDNNCAMIVSMRGSQPAHVHVRAGACVLARVYARVFARVYVCGAAHTLHVGLHPHRRGLDTCHWRSGSHRNHGHGIGAARRLPGLHTSSRRVLIRLKRI